MSEPTPHHAPPPSGMLVIRFCTGLGLALFGALVATVGMFSVGFGVAMMVDAAIDLHLDNRKHKITRHAIHHH